MNILIRVDSSIDIGSGHLMRCLSLAKKLKDNNHIVTFVCKKLPGSMVSYIDSLGYVFKEIECPHTNQIEDANKNRKRKADGLRWQPVGSQQRTSSSSSSKRWGSQR